MTTTEIIVAGLSALYVVLIAVRAVIKKKKGKSSCCGNCAHCKGCSINKDEISRKNDQLVQSERQLNGLPN